jgi:hypothetical protein
MAVLENFCPPIICIVLNACFSETGAKSLISLIPNVIGLYDEISDAYAIQFSIGFYQGIGAGKSIESAYKLAKSLVLEKNDKFEPALFSQGKGE